MYRAVAVLIAANSVLVAQQKPRPEALPNNQWGILV